MKSHTLPHIHLHTNQHLKEGGYRGLCWPPGWPQWWVGDLFKIKQRALKATQATKTAARYIFINKKHFYWFHFFFQRFKLHIRNMYGGVKWVILTWFVSSTLFMILSMRSVSQWVSKLFGCNGIMHSCSPDGPQEQERRQFNCTLRDNGPTERRCRNRSRASDKTQWEKQK